MLQQKLPVGPLTTWNRMPDGNSEQGMLGMFLSQKVTDSQHNLDVTLLACRAKHPSDASAPTVIFARSKTKQLLASAKPT